MKASLFLLGLVLCASVSHIAAFPVEDGISGGGVDYSNLDVPDEYYAEVLASKELPAVNSRVMALFVASVTNSTVVWELVVQHVKGMTSAYIHLGDSTSTGPIVVSLLPIGERNFDESNPPVFPKPVHGSFLVYQGVLTAEDFVGPWEGLDLDTLTEAFDNRETYVSVRTLRHPNGNARGQVHPAPEE